MNVLITGKNSYIGTNIKRHLESKGYFVSELDMLTDEWLKFDFGRYDVVLHVAAIVHQVAKNSTWEKFYDVNVKLPKMVAEKAKASGVKHFIFLSSMAVYGQEKKLPKGNLINKDTKENPVTMYGKSKYQAEKELEILSDDSFTVSIVRPPNVYGKDCPGNYMAVFGKIAKKMPLFPDVYNGAKQSFIYIDNLAELIRLIIEHNSEGVFTPQDDFIPSTPELLKKISEAMNKRIHLSKFLGVFIKLFRYIPVINKLYGGVSYDYEISNSFDYKYQIVSFQDGIRLTFEE